MSDEKRNEREETELLLSLTDTAHGRGVVFGTRTIYLGEEITSRAALQALKNFHVLEALSKDPIDLVINSFGGDVYHGLAIYDAIEASECDVIGRVRGSAMSAASIILQACTKRIMGPNATQMIHYGTVFADVHAKTFERYAEESARISKKAEHIYLTRIREKRPRFALKELQELLDHDTFLDATQSIALGLADGIG